MMQRAAVQLFITVSVLVCALSCALAQTVPPSAAPKASAKPGGGLGDGITADKVRHILYTDRRFDPSSIKVVSSSGTIALNGTVASRAARGFAQSDAQKAAHVRRVINRLKIAP